MTQADLKVLVDFNYWAHDRMLKAAAVLTAEQYVAPMGSSFASVRDTLVHMYSAEWVWYSRWTGTSPTSPVSPDGYPDLASLTAAWRSLEGGVRAFVDRLSDADITKVFEFKMMNGQESRSPVGQSIQHVVNHGSYHRGQIATLLRQAGARPAGTDLITYYRERTIGA